VGKSALLDHLARHCGTTPLRARGLEAESMLPFAALADLVLPLRAHLAALPATQRTALEVALALADGPAPNPYAVCAATLTLFGVAAEKEPVVILVDDLHWVDPSSRRVMLFGEVESARTAGRGRGGVSRETRVAGVRWL